MGLFDFLNNDKKKRRDSNSFLDQSSSTERRAPWDYYGPASNRDFGKDRYGYHYDEESMYGDDERHDDGDDW